VGARQLKVRGRDVRLTPKDSNCCITWRRIRTLRFRIRACCKPVWGPDYGGEVEYLRVFMNQLRKKNREGPSKPQYR